MMMKFLHNNLLVLFGVVGFTFSSCGCDGGKGEDPAIPPVQEDGAVSVMVTKNDRSLDFARQSARLVTGSSMSPLTITLDPATRYQEMDGFGSAITGSTCYNLMQMAPADRTKFLKETFSETEGLGQSYVRISIGCSDFSLSEYTCCDEPGIENFKLESEELDLVIPILKEILAINPAIKVLGSPWTCPRWMKVNNLTDLQPYNSWTSGQLNPKYYGDYGTYFTKGGSFCNSIANGACNGQGVRNIVATFPHNGVEVVILGNSRGGNMDNGSALRTMLRDAYDEAWIE